MSLLVGLTTLLMLFGAFTLVQTFYERLPDEHRSDESRDCIRQGVAVVATLTGLVLGLVLSSMKTNFDIVQRDVRHFGTELSSLDTTLRAYGPAAQPAREILLAYAQQALQGTWPNSVAAPEHGAAIVLDDRLAAAQLDEAERLVVDLTPAGREQSYFATRARTKIGEIVTRRATLISEDRAYMSPVFLVFVIAWLTILFASFGYRAPRNLTVATGMFCAAAVVSSAVFLMIELDGAFTGFITVSSQPVREAIASMVRL